MEECEFWNINAACLCMKCKNYFCESCVNHIHQLRKYSSHKKENIDPFVPLDLKCPEHPENIMNLFCIDEKAKLN